MKSMTDARDHWRPIYIYYFIFYTTGSDSATLETYDESEPTPIGTAEESSDSTKLHKSEVVLWEY